MKHTTGYIIDGKYYRDDDDPNKYLHGKASTHKSWDHDEQRRKHRRELIQPYKDGKPNEDFIAYFPQESEEQYGFIKREDQ